MSDYFSLGLNLGNFEAGIDAWADAAEAATRPAAQAMAQILVDGVKANVSKIKAKTGKLAAAIYQVYSKDNSTPVHAVYHVSWNARKAPHGHLVEYGHVQRYLVVHDAKTGRYYTRKDKPLAAPIHVPAQPFVRPAQALIPQAQEVGLERYYAELAAKGIVK